MKNLPHLTDAACAAIAGFAAWFHAFNEVLAAIAFLCTIAWYGFRFYDRYKAKAEDRKNISL